MKAGTFMQTLHWTCTSCGYAYRGGQPMMECPICEAYKSSFIDAPQHIEAKVIEAFGEKATNSADARAHRLELMREGGYLRRFRLKGRFVEAVNVADPSRGAS